MTADREARYARLEQAVSEWAQNEPAVRALIVVGSRARAQPPADIWSDLDLIAFVTDPHLYLAQTAWFEAFGRVSMSFLEATGAGDPEWYILYAGGIKLDVVLHALPGQSASAGLAAIFRTGAFAEVVGRGVRILVDKSLGSREDISGASPAGFEKPTQAAFNAVLHQAFFTAINTAKFIRRGDLWRAKQRCDCDLKRSLLTMLEWQAIAAHPDPPDVWFEGRFIEEWAETETFAQIPAAFGRYDWADLRRALLASLGLLRQAATSAARAWGYHYPRELDREVSALIRSIWTDDEPGFEARLE